MRLGSSFRVGVLLFGMLVANQGAAYENIRYGRAMYSGDWRILYMPHASFTNELAKFAPARPPTPRSNAFAYWDRTPADVRDLAHAMGMGRGIRAPVIQRYRTLRKVIDWQKTLDGEERVRAPRLPLSFDWVATSSPFAAYFEVLEEVPTEFRVYMEGAIAYSFGDKQTARAQWNGLLEMPEEQRLYTSVWAAYMLGRTSESERERTALKWYAKTRKMAAEGFFDTAGLAAGTHRRKSGLQLKRGDLVAAMHAQVAFARACFIGHGTSSLRLFCRDLLTRDAVPEALMRDTLSRRTLTVYAMDPVAASERARDSNRPSDTQRWLDAVGAAIQKDRIAVSPGEAVHLAWLAFRFDRFDEAAACAGFPKNLKLGVCMNKREVSLLKNMAETVYI